jgi:hypothetical protein
MKAMDKPGPLALVAGPLANAGGVPANQLGGSLKTVNVVQHPEAFPHTSKKLIDSTNAKADRDGKILDQQAKAADQRAKGKGKGPHDPFFVKTDQPNGRGPPKDYPPTYTNTRPKWRPSPETPPVGNYPPSYTPPEPRRPPVAPAESDYATDPPPGPTQQQGDTPQEGEDPDEEVDNED